MTSRGLRLPAGGFKLPAGLLQVGDHLVRIRTAMRQKDVKQSGNTGLEIQFANADGVITHFCVVTEKTLFQFQEIYAATGTPPRKPNEIDEKTWESWLKGFGYLENDSHIDRMCADMEKRTRPCWITIISRPDNKGQQRLNVEVMNEEKMIRGATDTEIASFQPYSESGGAVEEEEGGATLVGTNFRRPTHRAPCRSSRFYC